MKLIGFQNETLTSPYSPSWHFCIGEKDNIGIDCNELKEFLLSKEEEVLSIKNKEVLDHAFGTKLGKNSTTARAGMFNVLERAAVKETIPLNFFSLFWGVQMPEPGILISKASSRIRSFGLYPCSRAAAYTIGLNAEPGWRRACVDLLNAPKT